MDSYKKVIFIATEPHMMKNYSFLKESIEKKADEVKVLFLNVLNPNRKNRLFCGKKILRQARNEVVTQFGETLKDTLIIYSNGEGFLLYNRRKWLPQLQNCKEVFLLHGVLSTSHNMFIMYFKGFLNYVYDKIFGYGLWGPVFGAIKADKIVVLGDIYKKMLLKEGWRENDIIVAGNLLKPSYEYIEIKDNTCLLLLQVLAPKLMSEIEMQNFYCKIVSILSSYYDLVVVRKHPKMSDDFVSRLKISAPLNVCFSNKGLDNDILSVKRVFSCMSAALIDAYVAGKEVVAIKCGKISPKAYAPFLRVVPVEKLDNYMTEFRYEDSLAKISSDFYKESDVETSLDNLLEYNK